MQIVIMPMAFTHVQGHPPVEGDLVFMILSDHSPILPIQSFIAIPDISQLNEVLYCKQFGALINI